MLSRRMGSCLLLTLLFYIISFSLGYHIINKFIVELVPAAADASIYLDLVKHGTSAIGSDHRSSRILMPMLARGISFILPAKLGKWDLHVFSLLLVNAAVCTGIGLIIYYIGRWLRLSAQTAFIAALLFFLNFAVTNYYLASLVDAGECLCLLLTACALLVGRWYWLPIIGLLGISTKETFFPIATIFICAWGLYEIWRKRQVDYAKVAWFLLFCVLSFMMVVALKSMAYGKLTYPWQYAAKLYHIYPGVSWLRVMLELKSFLYVFIWLLPLGLLRLTRFPQVWVFASFMSILVILAMSIWAGTSGAAISRYIFNLAGPLLCLSAALYLNERLN